MIRLTRTVAYALHAVLQLAESPQEIPVPCSKLAAQGQMPERFLLQVLRNLVTHGLLLSSRGVDGGYRLARSIDEISLVDLIEAVEGPFLASMPEMPGLPPRAKQQLAETLAAASERARDRLAEVRLADLTTLVEREESHP